MAGLSALAVLYFARSRSASSAEMQLTPCGTYKPAVPRCTPASSCGRMVVDEFASADEVEALAGIAARGMALGGGAGGPTILDLQSGALSYKDKVNATKGGEVLWDGMGRAGGSVSDSDLRATALLSQSNRRHLRRSMAEAAPPWPASAAHRPPS